MSKAHLVFVGVLAVFITAPPARLLAAEATDEKPLWLAVGTPDLIDSVRPLAEHRRRNGFQTLVSVKPVEEAIKTAPRRPEFLLLVGDDQPGAEGQPWYQPARRVPLYRWRAVQPKEFASDAAWGDFNGDLIPDIPVGRIPARSPEQVQRVVDKILAYEQRPPTASDLKVAMWFGSPEYGPAIDSVATGMGLVILRTKAPKWLVPWVISGNPRDSLCGNPEDQSASFTQELKQGGLCSMLMGHANSESFCSMKNGDKWILYNATLAADELAEGPPAAPMFVLSCESGAFTRPEPCFAESFLLLPGGPVATIAATTESHPLTNYFSGVCLLQAVGGSSKHLGTLWLGAQRRAMKARDLIMEMMLRDVEGKLEERINVQKLRRDQVLMYALLGDPATQLRLPQPLEVRVERTDAGWIWKAERPAGATRIEIGFRAEEPLRVELARRPADPEAARAALRQANDSFGFAPRPGPAEGSSWQGTIDQAGWVRLIASGREDLYVAIVKLESSAGR